MKITIENTTRSAFLDGVECRIWEGSTETGIPVFAFIPRIGVPHSEGQDLTQFEAELKEQRAPSAELAAFPLSIIL